MTCPRRAFSRFLRCERGAITVEYVVLAAGVTALGLAAFDSIGGGLRDFSSGVSTELTGVDATRGADLDALAEDFSDGAVDWTGAIVTDVPGFGRVLGPITGSGGVASVVRQFTMRPGQRRAVLSFDLMSLDSLDGEDAVFYVNGREVGRLTARAGTVTLSPGAVAGVTMFGDVIAQEQQLGGYMTGDKGWERDAITSITLTVDDPGAVMSFGIGSTADSGASDESFALDNVVVTGVARP
ncbi:hypothetical protein [Jannaschia sp. LMIT008]|uniref:Flp family type IVb pilin n=1 Tax=Jannaschia maritima TaxID=3032585 RepID=UPI002811B963|nr:hypothetical protein [Jannaschia sp. LMIT008]